MKTIDNLEEFESILHDVDGIFDLIYFDDANLLKKKKINKADLIKVFEGLKNKYGIAMNFRAFNDEIDIFFKNGFGMFISEKGTDEKIIDSLKVCKIPGFGYRFKEMV